MTTAVEPTALARLADDYWAAWLAVHPTFATAIGERQYDDRLEDNSPAARAAWRRQLDGFETQLGGLPDDVDTVTRAALGEALRTDRAYLDADMDAFSVDAMDGPHVSLLNIPSFQPVRDDDEAAALLARWRAMPAYLDQAGDDLRRGLGDGRVGVRTICERVLDQIDGVLAQPDAEWPLAEPAKERPEIHDELLGIIGREIRPAFERYRAVVADEVMPRARDDDHPGLSHVPGGSEA